MEGAKVTYRYRKFHFFLFQCLKCDKEQGTGESVAGLALIVTMVTVDLRKPS